MAIDIKKFLGGWIEIARIPNDFEPNMKDVTAGYAINCDGTIDVVNCGYLDGELMEIHGTARQTEQDDLLKVSFFKGIESDYKILAVFDVGDTYKYALVGGSDMNHLWLLSRTFYIVQDVYDKFIRIAEDKGYDVDRIEITESLEV